MVAQRSIFAFAVLLVCLGSGARLAAADEAVLSAVATAAIYEADSSPTANGAGTGLFVGRTAPRAGSLLRRSLLRFDIEAAVPSGATIEAVSLTLQVTRVPDGSAHSTTLHRVTSPWNEGPTIAPGEGGFGGTASAGDATWLHATFPGSSWTPGGEFDPSVHGTVLMDNVGSYSMSDDGRGLGLMVQDVQSWLDTPSTNFGWLLRGAEATGSATAKRIGSRHHPTTPPQLTITYSAGPGGGAGGLLAVPTMSNLGQLGLILLIVFSAWHIIRKTS